MNQEHFTKIPNKYIQCDIKAKYGISRKFYIIYILIDRHRSRDNVSWLTLRCVLDFYRIKIGKNKPKAVHEIIDVLKYMVTENMIWVNTDLNSLLYDTCIKIRINPDVFDSGRRFTKITFEQMDSILAVNEEYSKEGILLTFLYINSRITCRRRKKDGSEYADMDSKPEAFFGTVESIAQTLSMAKRSIYNCLDFLISEGDHPLLVKGETNRLSPKQVGKIINLPNIYVLNKDGWEREIELAKKQLLEMYKNKGEK